VQIAHDLPQLKDRPDNLQAALEQIVRKGGVPGISVALWHDGRVTSAAAGARSTRAPASMSTDSRFMMGSLGKFLVCMSAMESIASHQLDADEMLGTYLEELRHSELGRNVTLWHLMSHTSGFYQRAEHLLEALEFNSDWANVVRQSSEARPLFTPGAVFSYDSRNYVLCGEILRRLHGTASRDLIKARILDPLDIEGGDTESDAKNPEVFVEGHTRTASGTCEPAPKAEVSELWEPASCSLTLSMPDLARIAGAVMGAPGSHSALLSAAARRMLLTQSVELPIGTEWPVRDCTMLTYGSGCGKHRNGSLGHHGASPGQLCALHFDPEKGIAVAVGVNARAFNVRESTLTMLMRSMGCSTDTATLKRATFEPGELPGIYVGGCVGRAIEVREHDSRFICRFISSHETSDSRAMEGKLPEVRFHLTAEGHAERDEQWRQFPMCFFREPGGRSPLLFAGTVCYRQVQTTGLLE
jgi:CubicO group peptidase (beta-lactamase class C family)